MKTGAELIASERTRQIEVEGWTADHDSDFYHSRAQLAKAASCYIYLYMFHTLDYAGSLYVRAKRNWPWDMEWFKPLPDDPIRELVKAGALIAAEIDRLQRVKG